MIILAVQGSGKSYAAAQRNDVADVDRIRGKESVDDYVERLLQADQEYRYACGNARLDIAEELEKRGQKFTIFAPFRELLEDNVYQEMKERIFGRLVLRKEQNAYTCKYIEDFKAHYDTFNSIKYYDDLSSAPVFEPMDRDTHSIYQLIIKKEEKES